MTSMTDPTNSGEQINDSRPTYCPEWCVLTHDEKDDRPMAWPCT